MFLYRKTNVRVGDLKPSKKNIKNFDSFLVDDIQKKGYDNNKSRITVDLDFKIIDGHHRFYLIKNKYGEDKIITVDKLYIPYFLFFILFIFFYIIFYPIIFLLNLFFTDGFNLIIKKNYDGLKKSRRRNN